MRIRQSGRPWPEWHSNQLFLYWCINGNYKILSSLHDRSDSLHRYCVHLLSDTGFTEWKLISLQLHWLKCFSHLHVHLRQYCWTMVACKRSQYSWCSDCNLLNHDYSLNHGRDGNSEKCKLLFGCKRSMPRYSTKLYSDLELVYHDPNFHI